MSGGSLELPECRVSLGRMEGILGEGQLGIA